MARGKISRGALRSGLAIAHIKIKTTQAIHAAQGRLVWGLALGHDVAAPLVGVASLLVGGLVGIEFPPQILLLLRRQRKFE
jgi:hypothetical protein